MGVDIKKWLVWIGIVLLVLVFGVLVIGFHGWFTGRVPVVESVVAQSDKSFVGVPIVYRVSVRAPLARLPQGELEVDLPGNVSQVRLVGPTFDGVGVGEIAWSWEIAVQAYEVGFVGPFYADMSFSSTRGETRPFVVRAELPGFEVVSSSVKPGQSLVVAPVLLLPDVAGGGPKWRRWVLLGLVTLIVVLILVSILFRSGDEEEDEFEESLGFWESAWHELDELEASLPVSPEVFFVRITDVLRGYVEERFGLPAGERTTPEFLREMKDRPQFDDDQRGNLASVLNFADVVKFGRGEASEERMRSVIGQAREFIVATRPELKSLESAPGEVGSEGNLGADRT